MTLSRRDFLEFSAASTAAAGAVAQEDSKFAARDGPASPNFSPVPIEGNFAFDGLASAGVSRAMASAAAEAPRGSCVCWGIPFEIGRPLVLSGAPVTKNLPRLKAGWLVFLHTTDLKPLPAEADGLIRPMRGEGFLAEHVADYVLVYADETESRSVIRRRHQIGMFRTVYGDNCFQSVAHLKPFPVRPLHEQSPNFYGWGGGEMRGRILDRGAWINWVWAWRNPYPEKELAAIRFVSEHGGVVISALSVGHASIEPLRWRTRRKAVIRMPAGLEFDYRVDRLGRRTQIELDMGQIISADRRRVYPDADWENLRSERGPQAASQEVLIEYTSHPEARFHLWDGSAVPVSELEASGRRGPLTRVAPATRRVRLRVLDRASGRPVPVRLHIHGESGEYLTPLDRHRHLNPAWFEDYAPEYLGAGLQPSTYIAGETVVDLPVGIVCVEASKGFEAKPVRRRLSITASTSEVDLTIQKVLPWRERGWVTADTHVHFLSPQTARLEGSAEGVNVVNLLASQWGELMTNVGDFDGKSTFGSKEAGGDGEWLVRVGTENRQRVLGHISLLGYGGDIIAPMCAGGPDEAALGDPIGMLLMEWAERCRQQGGIVISPHFPNPRGENAGLLAGLIDGIEMSGSPARGISPYSLSDYYRYLNCGCFVAAVGGTDKMSARTAVGALRTYARIPVDREFTYDSWKDAVRSGNTFATYGPLMEFVVDGRPPGGRITMRPGGGTVDVGWEVASVTLPLSKVELVVNGEIRESRSVQPDRDSGRWAVKVDRCSWLALRVRGRHPGEAEIIGAHSSPVMIDVDGTGFFSAVDAITMLDQIEGTLAFIDTVGTRVDDEVYKRMRMKLTAAHRRLHNELHQRGHFHEHAIPMAHS